MVLDARGIEINPGAHVRYTETGTISKVVDLKTENNTHWVKFEKPDLWYLSNYVEILDSKDLEKDDSESKKDVKKDLKNIKQQRDTLKDFELASNEGIGGG